MPYQLTAKPALEPVSLTQAKAQLNIDWGDDDALLETLITAARMQFERQTGRSLITQSWQLTLEGFPWPRGREPHPHFASVFGFTGEPIRLQKGPIQSVDHLYYIDFESNQQEIVAATIDPIMGYLQDLNGDVGRISPVLYQPWPWAPRRFEAVTVDFTSGYGDTADAVDLLICQCILMIVAHWYANREAVAGGEGRFMAVEIPMAAQSIIDSYWIPSLG